MALPHMAVNVSPRQFRKQNFIDSIASIVGATRYRPSCLELEITESLLIDAKSGNRRAMLNAIAPAWASRSRARTISEPATRRLAYLKRFPREYREDRQVIHHRISASARMAGAIAAAVIAMAHALQKARRSQKAWKRSAQVTRLARLGCRHIPGLLLQRAASRHAMFAELRETGGRRRRRARRLLRSSSPNGNRPRYGGRPRRQIRFSPRCVAALCYHPHI
jgi:EAL domain-containing protein (putative c-di-GMP-specific phosphodiesterase class I)